MTYHPPITGYLFISFLCTNAGISFPVRAGFASSERYFCARPHATEEFACRNFPKLFFSGNNRFIGYYNLFLIARWMYLLTNCHLGWMNFELIISLKLQSTTLCGVLRRMWDLAFLGFDLVDSACQCFSEKMQWKNQGLSKQWFKSLKGISS